MRSRRVKMWDRAELIIRHTCLQEGITLTMLESGRRTKTIARIRQEIAKRLREQTSLSWSEIGTLVGRSSNYRGDRKIRV